MQNISVLIRLSIMMFLQFFVWGAWYVTGPKYLSQIGFGESDLGWTYSVGPIAGMISPFFVGFVADRYFSTERVLACMHLAGAALMFFATTLMQGGSSPSVINIVLFAYMLCFFPTLSLTASLAMQNLGDSEKQFPLVRVFGTIGWIVAGVVVAFSYQFGLSHWDQDINMFYLSGGAGLVLGLFSFALPHTPPPAKGKKPTFSELAGLDALRLFKKRSFLIFMLCSFAICIPLAFYYQLAERSVTQAGVADPAFKMTFGQMSEIIFMVIMPLFFVRLGVKWMLAVGMLAWVVRYGLFAFGAPVSGDPLMGTAWMMLVGIVLHGICYDFFFVTGQIYTDKVAPKEIRGQAQGLLVFFTLGFGMFIGAQVAGQVGTMYTPEASREANEQVTQLSDEIKTLEEQAEANTELIAAKTEEKNELQLKALQGMDWKMIWGIPAIAALVVLIVFVLTFKVDRAVDEESKAAIS